jgi:hypothetical protein
MKTIQQRQIEILEWERNNRNINNRCYSIEEGCTYSGEIGCAVGRIIEDKNLCEEFDGIGSVEIDVVFYELPEEIQDLGLDFLQDLQDLHDSYLNWDQSGLSPNGLIRWTYIFKKYSSEQNSH